MTRQDVFEYLQAEYGLSPEYTFGDDEIAVLRHPNSKKWFGVLMPVPRFRLGLDGDEAADVMCVHCPGFLAGTAPGYIPAYHMNKKSWLGLVLADVESSDEVCLLLDDSYKSVSPLRKKAKKTSVPD